MAEDITKPILEEVDELNDLEEGLHEQGGKDARAIAITRLIVSVVTIINIVMAAFGWQPLGVDAESVYLIISSVLAVIATVWSWWKNNNMTKAAQESQILLDTLKKQ